MPATRLAIVLNGRSVRLIHRVNNKCIGGAGVSASAPMRSSRPARMRRVENLSFNFNWMGVCFPFRFRQFGLFQQWIARRRPLCAHYWSAVRARARLCACVCAVIGQQRLRSSGFNKYARKCVCDFCSAHSRLRLRSDI